MEPIQPIVNHIRCSLHQHDVIRKIGINNCGELALLCVDCCLEGNQSKELFILEKFLEKITQSYAQIPKLQQLPDSTNQILNTENEILANFSHHIEQQKEQVNLAIDKLRQSVYQELENKKRQLIANLEAQLKSFEEVINYYKRKVFNYKEGEGQEIVPTFESLYKEIIKMNSATELKKLMVVHHENMKNAEIFNRVKGDEAKMLVANAIEAMDAELMKAQTLKPTISFGENNEGLDETLKKWTEQIETTINGLKIETKDPVKAIKFQLQDSMNFDSLILGDNAADKTMIASWVFEKLNPNRSSLNLLYRGTRDGFTANNFHQVCDNKGPTLVIVKSNHGKVFGGFTDVAWDSTETYKNTKNAFLFSVDRKKKYDIKPGSENSATYSYTSYGPTFGGGHDIYICDNSNTAGNSYAYFPYSYVCDEQVEPTGSSYLAGAYKFTATEIEVYSVESQVNS